MAQDFAEQELALDTVLAEQNQLIGRLKAMLEVQQWAEEHKDVLRMVGLHESLLKVVLP